MFNRFKRKSKPLPREVREAMDDPEFQKQVRDLMLASQQASWKENVGKTDKSNKELEK